MAKGQKRSNREKKKPKQNKPAAPKPNSPFGAQAGLPASGGAKKK